MEAFEQKITSVKKSTNSLKLIEEKPLSFFSNYSIYLIGYFLNFPPGLIFEIILFTLKINDVF